MSVVVPTYRRPDLLRRSLQALTSEDYPPNRLEVIVVEDGGPGECKEVVERAAARSPVEIKYLAVPHGGPAAARNAGWKAARGEIIAFTDDDTIPSPRWLAEGVASFQDGADVVSGRTVVPLPPRPSDAQRNVQGLERATLATCNAFCRRSFLEATGGFDPRFTRAYREDSDLEFTLRKAGAQLVHNPDAIVLHPPREEPRFVSLKQQRNQFFDALLYRKHPEMFRRWISPGPPIRHYVVSAGQLATIIALLAGQPIYALMALVIWVPLVLAFALSRLRDADLSPSHVFEMLVTSFAIPPVAVYWRIRGALSFRVPFV